MSCILYNRASYRELTTRPTFCELWRDLFASSYYESPEAFADALFELNARAYCDRYNETAEAVEGARETDDAGEFSEYVNADTATRNRSASLSSGTPSAALNTNARTPTARTSGPSTGTWVGRKIGARVTCAPESSSSTRRTGRASAACARTLRP